MKNLKKMLLKKDFQNYRVGDRYMDQWGDPIRIVQINRFSSLSPIKIVFENNDYKIGVLPDYFKEHAWVKISNRNGANT